MFERVTLNLATAGKRKATLEGREYWVVPTVMLTHGVHAGSDGPGYYPEDELGKTPGRWNHKPIVVDHPVTANGQGVSACEPAVLETRRIGLLLNTMYRGKLATESWIDIEKASKVEKGQIVLDAILNNQMLECSTGLQCDKVPGEGTYNGKAYNWTARNMAPDHLAILPDSVGACSIADGGGFLRNEEFDENRCHITNKKSTMSHSNIWSALNAEIRPKLTEGDNRIGFVEDVYDKFFVYSMKDVLYRQSYSIDGTDVKVTGNPERVERVTEYRTAETGAFVGNDAGGQLQESGNMARKEEVDSLIANKCGIFTETDREHLTKMPDDRFALLVANMAKEGTTTNAQPSQAPVQPTTPATPVAPAVVANQGAPQQVLPTGDQILAALPPEYRQVFNNGLAWQNQERTRLTGLITNNPGNQFKPEDLAKMDLPMLSQVAALANGGQAAQQQQQNYPQLPNYFGAAGVMPVMNSQPVIAADDMMEAPTMNFDPAKS